MNLILNNKGIALLAYIQKRWISYGNAFYNL